MQGDETAQFKLRKTGDISPPQVHSFSDHFDPETTLQTIPHMLNGPQARLYPKW